MDGTGAGTAIMIAVAAVLWFVYFVPTWLRRREYLATERTATRLQQTIRVMAETAEVPEEVRVAVTARDAARVERQVRAQAARAAVDAESLRRRRQRRTRLGASLVLLAAMIAVGVQLWLVASTGMSLGGFFVLVAGVAAGGAAIAVQRRLDAVAAPRASAPVRTRTAVHLEDVDVPRAPSAPWTPVQVPRPLYLSRPAPQAAPARTDLAESLRAAAAASEAALREAHEAPEVAPLRSAPPAASTSRYARMGVLGPDAVEAPDLDEVLRRRRSAG
jgi:hypothetical protein